MSDIGVKKQNSFKNEGNETPKRVAVDDRSNFSKTKQSTNKKETSGTQRRTKRVSAYEASDEEMTEFEKLENQLGVKELKHAHQEIEDKVQNVQVLDQVLSHEHVIEAVQDVAQPKKKKRKAKKKRIGKVPVEAVEGIMALTPGQDIIKQPDTKKKSKCLGIFCCGYCCSKSNAEKEKENEANLSRPEKKQDIEIPKKDKKKKVDAGNQLQDQDLSIEEEQQQDGQDQDGDDEQSGEDGSYYEEGEEEEDVQEQDSQDQIPEKENDEENKQEDQINQSQVNMSNNTSINLQSNVSGSEPVEKKQLSMSDDEEHELIDDRDMESKNNSPNKNEKFMRIENESPDSQMNIPEGSRSNSIDNKDELNQEESKEEKLEDDEEDNHSDKTHDNDNEEYKQAQAKRMFVIQEVDEDTLSEKSMSKRDISQVISQRNTIHLVNEEGKLETLKEVNEEDDQIFVVKEIGALDNIGDVSQIQVNASQDIEPRDIIENDNNFDLKQRSSVERKSVEEEQKQSSAPRLKEEEKLSSPERISREKSKTLYERQNEQIAENNNEEIQSKSFVEFTRLLDMEDEREAKEQNLQQPQPSDKQSQKESVSQTSQKSQKSQQKKVEEIKKGARPAPGGLKRSYTSKKPEEKPQQVVQQVVVQKVNIDKSKLSTNFYASFDQFLVANSMGATKEDNVEKEQNLIEQELKKALEEEKKLQSNANDKETIKKQKQEAMKKLKERKSQLEQQKLKLVSQARESALKKESDRKAKQRCAINIQKVWKGFVQRKEYKVLKHNLDMIKKLRKIFESYQNKQKQDLLNEIRGVLKDGKSTVDKERAELMENFVTMCAICIQKNWRGHYYRRNFLPQLQKVRNAEERIRAFVKGWKMRKVMQTKEVFVMNQYIKDLKKVQEYFLYVEKSDNMMLLEALKKDRKRAVENCVSTIKEFQETGDWVKSYIGNKIIENEENESTDDGQTPLKDGINADGERLQELITTERFFSEEELKRNPYIFEPDEFVRQKFLESKYKEYEGVQINNDEFVKQNIPKNSDKSLKQQSKSKKHYNDDQSSRYESDSQQFVSQLKTKKNNKQLKNQERNSVRSTDPKDNVVLPKHDMTFDQMLENAMQNDKSEKLGHSKSQSNPNFLKRKEKYDPKKSIQQKQGTINQKNIDKKRLFKKQEESNYESETSHDQALTEGKGTFANVLRKSVVQTEESPRHPNKTVLPPSLLEKLYREQEKIQKFFRSETGRVIGGGYNQSQQPLSPVGQDAALPTKQKDDKQVIYELEELEAIYKNYYGTTEQGNFDTDPQILREKSSNIPVMKQKALFFNYYDDSVYESVLEDLKRDYQKQTNVAKRWHYGQQ